MKMFSFLWAIVCCGLLTIGCAEPPATTPPADTPETTTEPEAPGAMEEGTGTMEEEPATE